MISAEELMLLTLRAAVNPGCDVPEGAFDGAGDELWQKVIDMSREQGLLAICQDGAAALMAQGFELNIGKQLRRSWFSRAVNYETKFAKYEKVVEALSGFYAKGGIDTMIMKGYGLARLYPDPRHRPCGDIDLWLFGKQEEADKLLQEKTGGKVDNTHHIHSVFKVADFTVENHHHFFNPYSYRSNRRVNEVLEELSAKELCTSVEVGRATIMVPSADFNALYLTRHAAQHFAAIEIKLRHLLDWAFFCKSCHRDIHWERLLPLIRDLNMARFLQAVDAICVDYMGFPEDIFPPLERDYDLEMRVFEAIIAPEYPESAKPTGNLLKLLPWKWRRWRSNLWKQRIVYNEGAVRTFFAQILSHVLKPDTFKI